MDAPLAVIGAGYVGLTTAAGLAHLGHRVTCVDIDADKIERLRRGHVDLAEPELPQLVNHHQRHGTLSFHTQLTEVVALAHTVFLALPTPGQPDGHLDLDALEHVTAQLAALARPDSTIVVRSTVPPGTHQRLSQLLHRTDVALVTNPEFLREGSAVRDFLTPARVVVGTHGPTGTEHLLQLYGTDAPVVTTDPTSAELIKYAANSYLALRLTYVNTLAELCERLGAGIADVLAGIGHDSRIGATHLHPGPGWGGPCLPKDTRALARAGTTLGCDMTLLDATLTTNTHHQRRVVDHVERSLDRPLADSRIGVLGLSFKAGTNDLRDSPAVPITAALTDQHAHVRAYDPALGSTPPAATAEMVNHLTLTTSATDALTDCDLALLLTDWPEFATLNWSRIASQMRGNVVIDTRNQLDPDSLEAAGLRLHSTGIRAGKSVQLRPPEQTISAP